MNAKKCDRCGMLYEYDGITPDLRVNKYTHPYGDRWYDLCPHCQKYLERFLANFKLVIEKENNNA